MCVTISQILKALNQQQMMRLLSIFVDIQSLYLVLL